MAEQSPRDVQRMAQRGMRRLTNFRQSRLMFLRGYVGQYYDRDQGRVGDEPLNLIFNAVRILVPNLVMNFPKWHIASTFVANRDYAELLSLALDQHGFKTKIKHVYRQAIVDAIFTLGILKTGLAESDSVYVFEDEQVDTGEIFTEAVDFDAFICDPDSEDHLFRDARFLGDTMTLPRETLLDSGLYKNDLIEELPSVAEQRLHKAKAAGLSRREIESLHEDPDDEVEIAELWFPETNALVTIPAAKDVVYDKFLRTDDYYGPSEGPYTFLALTPPVPGNPLPVPAVGVWQDLHVLANRMASKIVDQADRQKDVVAYRPEAADDAEELQNAGDGHAVAVNDPDAVKVLSFGGQQQSNEVHLSQLQMWFNMMAANPQGIGGQELNADSATEARILQGNANIGLEDMKDLVYEMAAEEGRKRAWYLHTDPLIELPLIRREEIPGRYEYDPLTGGPVMVDAPRSEDRQVFLTPETRRGDWIDFTFRVEPDSMGRVDSATRLQQAFDFAVKIVPSVAQTTQLMTMMGIRFNPKAFIIKMAREAGITWMDQVFEDPEFQQKMAALMQMGPQAGNSTGTLSPGASPVLGGGLDQFLQNGQLGSVGGGTPPPETRERQDQQAGAAQGQSELRGLGGLLGGV